MNLYEIITPEKARQFAMAQLHPRRTLTFQLVGERASLPAEEVRGARIISDGVVFEVSGVEDTWDAENGIRRTCTAVEKFPDEYSEMDEPR